MTAVERRSGFGVAWGVVEASQRGFRAAIGVGCLEGDACDKGVFLGGITGNGSPLNHFEPLLSPV